MEHFPVGTLTDDETLQKSMWAKASGNPEQLVHLGVSQVALPGQITYVYSQVLLCTCSHACMHGCMYVCMYAYIYACMHACVYACMYIYIYACM